MTNFLSAYLIWWKSRAGHSMIITSSRFLLETSQKSRSFFALLSTLSQRIKLADVPEVCTTDEWNNIIRQSRTALQAWVTTRGTLKVEGQQNPTPPLQAVVRKLQRASPSNDHLINSFKYLLGNEDETVSHLRWPGLIILLLSQGTGKPFITDNFISKQLADFVWSSQVVLAQIINTLHCSLVLRKENLRASSSRKNHKNSTNQVDRLISGFFTSSSISKFPALKNHKVVFLLSDVLESLAKTKLSLSTNTAQITNRRLWEYDTFQSQGILLANGCQAALELAGHDDKLQELAFEFGHLFSLAIKANSEIQQLYDYQKTKSSSFNMSGFPVAVHLENHPETLKYIYDFSKRMDNLHIDQINSKLISSSCLNEARHHLEDYVTRTLETLENFPSCRNSEMFNYLFKLVKTLSSIIEE